MDKIEKGFEAIESDYDIKKIYEQMENDLIASMKRNLGSHKADEKLKGFNWPQWQAIKLKQLQEYRKQNKDIFKNFDSQINIWTKIRMKKQFREGAKRAVKKAIKAGKIRKEDAQLGGSFFGLNHRKLDALIKSTSEDLKDVKYATLRMANDVYRSTIYKAQVCANAGAKTLNQAIDMATKDFLARGFNCIEYKDGSKHNIADYCDMAIRTATMRANLMGEGEMRKKLGNPLVYISKHNTSCDKCGKWQGRVYIDDVWSGGTEKDGKYPLLSTAIAGGLFHPRCRHGASTYYEGVNDEPEEIQESEENKNDEYIQELQRRKTQYERMAMGSLFTDNIKNYTNKANDLKKQIENATIMENNKNGANELEYIGKIDKEKFSEISEHIITEEVVLTDKQRQHIIDRHPEIYEMVKERFAEIIEEPDFILKDNLRPNTALILKTLEKDGKSINLVLRLAVEGDDVNNKNSIITCIPIGKNRIKSYKNNGIIIYKNE